MQSNYLSALLICCLTLSYSFTATAQNATTSTSAADKFGQPRASTNGSNNTSPPNNDKDNEIDTGCNRAAWLAGKCSDYPGSVPRHRRPIIIVPPPAPAPVDDTPLASDWEGCKKTKLNQLNLTQNGNLDRAKQLDEWLWKNCRSYSEDLRQLEQDRM